MFDGSMVQGLPLFMLAVLVLNATPGVDLLLTVSRTAQAGTRAGVGAALGICFGATVHVLAGAFGLVALLAVSANAFWLIKWAGAAYLAWLGLGLLVGSGRPAAVAVSPAPAPAPGQAAGAPQPAPQAMGPDFRRGVLTNLLNPKVALFLLAFLPQFVSPTASHKTIAFLSLGAVFVLQSLIFLLATVALTRRLSRWPMWHGSAGWLKRAAGLMFLGLALRLAVTDTDAR